MKKPAKVVLATGNKGKVREFNQILSQFDCLVVPQNEFDVPEVAETGTTFVENAIIKARNAAKITGLPAIADDSGLEVDHLKGAPGIYSSRYAGTSASDQDNVDKLLDALKGIEKSQRKARFQCVIVYLRHADDPTPRIYQASWEGEIATQTSGTNGFGYDPVFWLEEQNCCSADLASDIKNRLSHRGQAIQKLLADWQQS